MITNKTTALQALIKNAFARHRKQWLPYGAILLMLAGIWCLWDGVSSERQDMIREKKDVNPSSPVFSGLKEGDAETRLPEGRLVVPAAQAVRRRVLPDLFAPIQQEFPGKGVQGRDNAGKTEKSIFPRLCGIIYHDGTAAALLEWDGQSGACMTGDSFGGCTVVFIGEESAVLEKNGRRVTVTMDWNMSSRKDKTSMRAEKTTQKEKGTQKEEFIRERGNGR